MSEPMDREKFFARTAQAGVDLASPAHLQARLSAAAADTPMAIQIARHSLVDERIKRGLDTEKSTAREEAIILYSHNWCADHNRPPAAYVDRGVRRPVSCDYVEMRLENLQATGDTLRHHGKVIT